MSNDTAPRRWTTAFHYNMGLDDVVLEPDSASRAWQLKHRVVSALDRISAATGKIERIRNTGVTK